jgi:hypothetical protein
MAPQKGDPTMSSKEQKRGAGPDASVPDTFAPGNKRTSAEATQKRYDPAALAKGGRNRDVGEQNADLGKPGQTGKRNSTGGPGKQFADGEQKMHGFDGALPAVAGTVTQPKAIDTAGRVKNVQVDTEGAGGGAFRGKTVVPENAPHSVANSKNYPKDNSETKPARDGRPSRQWFKGE